MRNRLRMIGVGLAAATTMVLVQAPTASAATWTTFYAQESVKIRQKPTKSSTALGLVPKSAAAKALMSGGSVKVYQGGMHNACGSKGNIKYNQWDKVRYKGITGYVPHPCMLPFKP